MEQTEILEKLKEQLAIILPIYISEFGSFMSEDKIDYLQDDKNIGNIIQFSGRTGARCKGNNIIFGSDTNVLIRELLMNNVNYGKMPNKQLVSCQDFIDSQKDYLDYAEYFILKGGKELDFYLDILPHESMHLLGIGGGVLSEGVTERRTRQTCKKYNIRCAPISHSKENKLVGFMDKLVGQDVLTRMGFTRGNTKYDELARELDRKCGKGTFESIYNKTENLYQDTYIKAQYPNVIDRFRAYREMDFSPAFIILEKSIRAKDEYEL